MTEDDFKRIEENLAEEIRIKSCQFNAEPYANDDKNCNYPDIDIAPGTN